MLYALANDGRLQLFAMATEGRNKLLEGLQDVSVEMSIKARTVLGVFVDGEVVDVVHFVEFLFELKQIELGFYEQRSVVEENGFGLFGLALELPVKRLFAVGAVLLSWLFLPDRLIVASSPLFELFHLCLLVFLIQVIL